MECSAAVKKQQNLCSCHQEYQDLQKKYPALEIRSLLDFIVYSSQCSSLVYAARKCSGGRRNISFLNHKVNVPEDWINLEIITKKIFCSIKYVILAKWHFTSGMMWPHPRQSWVACNIAWQESCVPHETQHSVYFLHEFLHQDKIFNLWKVLSSRKGNQNRPYPHVTQPNSGHHGRGAMAVELVVHLIHLEHASPGTSAISMEISLQFVYALPAIKSNVCWKTTWFVSSSKLWKHSRHQVSQWAVCVQHWLCQQWYMCVGCDSQMSRIENVCCKHHVYLTSMDIQKSERPDGYSETLEIPGDQNSFMGYKYLQSPSVYPQAFLTQLSPQGLNVPGMYQDATQAQQQMIAGYGWKRKKK